MSEENVLYVEGRATAAGDIQASIETYISVFVLVNSEVHKVKLCFVNLGNDLYFSIPKDTLGPMEIQFTKAQQKLHCSLPFVTLSDQKTTVGGLCATLRWCIKNLLESEPDHPSKTLLGFRGGCLVSCAESSLWTKFCELEFPQSVTATAEYSRKADTNVRIPDCLLKLESHLKAPVKTHNISKRTRDLVKELKNDDSIDHIEKELCKKLSLSSGTHADVCSKMSNKPIKDFSLKHCYLEGIDFTLADVIIIPCVKLMLDLLPSNIVQSFIFIRKWFQEVMNLPSVIKAASAFGWSLIEFSSHELSSEVCASSDTDENLYSKCSTALKGKTKNLHPAPVISLLKENGVVPDYVKNNLPVLHWDQLPPALHPSFGDLPLKRIKRKCEQLQNIVSAVLKVVHPQSTIVDFCSGGGHVGLLLSYFLPDCKVFLVDNKEESMHRARKRARVLNLDNIRFYQCNLDYFNSSFDVGVSLHACGVATDLVMKKCISAKSAFVCCPCCYGAVQEIDGLTYPLSTVFHGVPITYKDYILLAHCADRTEKNTAKVHEGLNCMGLVDMDRLLYAKECGYDVELLKLEPMTCSPKHNLLIGTKIS